MSQSNCVLLFSSVRSSSLWCLVPWFTGMKPLRPSSASTRRSSVPLPMSQWQTQKRRTRGEEFCWSSILTRRLPLKSSFFHFSFSSSKRCRDSEKDDKNGILVQSGACAVFLEKCFQHGITVFIVYLIWEFTEYHWNAITEQELVLRTVSGHSFSLLFHFRVLYISLVT